jgi:uncharacterized short protein YbdD (DUF466 family)
VRVITASIRESWARLAKCACLMVGVPDYDTYVAHMRRQHPDRPVMSYDDFFRDRQNARYGADGRRGFRCC